MKQITLTWKPFWVNLKRMNSLLVENFSDYDGMIADTGNLVICFNEDITQQKTDFVEDYWESLTEQGEQTPTQQEQLEHIKVIIKNAVDFGQGLIINFAAENVAMGITQAGKTRDVATYLAPLQVLLNGGSLYGAIDTINDLITAGIPSDLSPFVTETRLLEYREIIETYLGI